MTAKTTGSFAGASPERATPTEAVGVLGLGIMGSAMSANLIKAGFRVSGYDPVAAARERLQQAGGTAVSDAADAIRSTRFMVLSLPSEAALVEATGHIVAAGSPGLIVAETSTLPGHAKQTAHDALNAAGITLLDCPLSGTGAQAVKRDLAVYASGDADAIAAMQPIFDGFARVTYPIGAFGKGMQMKMMANLLVSIHNVATAEALLMGSRMGIDLELAVRVLSDGAGGSRMMEVRGPVMSARSWKEPAMKVAVWQKDIKLISEALASNGVPAPLFAATIPIYQAAMGMGHGNSDTAAVYDVLERMSSPPG